MSKLIQKRGYYKLKEMNKFIENCLFVNIDYDEIVCEKFCKEFNCGDFLKKYLNRAIILSFMSEKQLYSTTEKSDQIFLKSFLNEKLWCHIKMNYELFIYTPTILFYWLKDFKNSIQMAEQFRRSMIVKPYRVFKDLNLSEKQSVWLNEIIDV